MPKRPVTSCASVAFVLLVFTCAKTASAEEAAKTTSAEEAPPDRLGPTVRAGSVVGSAHFAGQRVSVLGARIVLGHAIGPVAIHVAYTRCQMSAAGPVDNDRLGNFERLGAGAHIVVATKLIEPPVSSVRLWAEGGVGHQRARFDVGDGSRRTDVMAGFGLTFAFATDKPSAGMPSTWGWNLGWRLLFANAESGMAVARVVCQGAKDCGLPGKPTATDLSLVVGSEIVMRW